MVTLMNDIIKALRKYNQTLSKLTPMERAFTDTVEQKDYLFGFYLPNVSLPNTLEDLLISQNNFAGLLPKQSDKLCEYLGHIQEFTCNTGLVRMGVRSSDLSNYRERVTDAIGAFYVFYGAGLSLRELIYGAYKKALHYQNMAPVIALEIFRENYEVIGYCRDVLMSENNTAVLTRDVIVAIEQSHNRELQELLTKLLLAAKLQEGIRQSILETADEYQRDYFYRIIDVIREEKLLRYSSVQRSVLTWIGIGYEKVEQRLIETIFQAIYTFVHDEKARTAALEDVNPLKVYIALYVLGIKSMEKAVSTAVLLLDGQKAQVTAAALIYLQMTNHFPIMKYRHLLEAYKDDEWITALYIGECVRNDVKQLTLSEADCYHLFDLLIPFLKKLKSQQTYTTKGFEWFSITLHKEAVINFLAQLLIKAPERKRIEILLPYISSLWGKSMKEFLEVCFLHTSLPVRKAFMIKEIISSNEDLCNFVACELMKTSLEKEDIFALEGRLKTKKAYARAAIIKVLSKQPKACVRESYERLYQSQDKLIRESAVELQRLTPDCFDEIKETNIKIVGKEDGFGLYQRYQRYTLPETCFLKGQKKGFFKKKICPDLKFLNVWNKKEIVAYLTLWNQRIEAHARDEYQRFGKTYLVGDSFFYPLDYQKRSLEALAFADVWRRYFKEDALAPDVIFQLYFVMSGVGCSYDNIFSSELCPVCITADDTRRWAYYGHFSRIIVYYFYECDKNKIFLTKSAQIVELFLKHAQENIYRKRDFAGNITVHSLADFVPFSIMVQQLHLDSLDDADFRKYFPLVYHCYLRFNLECPLEVQNKMNIQPLIAARACALGILPQSMLMEMIMDGHTEAESDFKYSANRSNMLMEAFNAAYFENRGVYGKPHMEIPKENVQACVYLRETLDKISDALIRMETARLNEVSCITKYVEELYVVRGVKYLLIALKMLDGEDIKRCSYTNDRQTVFGNLIRKCYPLPIDSYLDLKNAKISEKRLVEVAMMAPQWMSFVNKVLEWDGFREACYYFIAHMKQEPSEYKKAEIAHYTDLNPEDLSDGAFDMEWCRTIYEKMGENRIKILCDASKLLCENSFHVRAKKYMDACMGKRSKEDYLKQASEKRNKDALNAYCIAPLEDEKDLLSRYLYVQKFLKESKAFGAQRRASEQRCCEIALMNLARNAHFDTAERLSWKMESRMSDKYLDVFEPKLVEDIEIYIVVDEYGKNEICISKNGKKLKNIPARLKNHDYVLHVKEAHQLLKEQYHRTRSMLERAMEERTEYDCAEIEAMSRHIIAGPLIKHLVMVCQGFFGFYQDGSLVLEDRREACSHTVRIAHAVDLYENHMLETFQKYLFERKIVQPFKQVFRELYLKLGEECECEYTKRYTGYQIQTKQAAGILKERGWHVSYEYGLEKVSYKYDTIVHLLADADWFSPSDIEAPSIDYVQFSHRRTGEPVRIGTVDDVLFSEIMRDVDLAVSRAYVGGVDPITSLSTIELRKSIVAYTCQLMKLKNVIVEGNFAHITGTYNDYSVHLGSGVVHQKAGSTIHLVPVWSGQRGKVYLPFLDEDPLTAQIVSKVVLFADDVSIKDPAILEQICL